MNCRFSLRGFSLVEVVITTALALVLALVALPMTDIVSQREKEDQLRQSLLEMRSAIDRYFQRVGSYPVSLNVLLTATDSYGVPLMRKLPNNPLGTGTFWNIASRTSVAGVNDHWEPVGSPLGFCATTTMSDNSGIVDVRCPPAASLPGNWPEAGTNGIRWEKW